MKLAKKVKAILCFAVIAVISLVGAACSNTIEAKKFEFTREMPAEVLYGSELYFRDYLPREIGQDYKLYASYYNVDEQKEVVDEVSSSLAFSFDYVSDYNFRIVRNDKDTLECTIKSMPQVPRVIDGATLQQTARPTNVQSLDRLLIMVFGGSPLENNENASADPDYEIKATNVEFQSVEIEGTDVKSLDISTGRVTFDKVGYYKITYTATNRAGTDDGVVTVRTVNTANHIDLLTGCLMENGEGLDDNQLVFDMDIMTPPEDGDTIRVRFGDGKGAQSSIYNARYDAYTGKYTVDNFAQTMTKDDIHRIYLEDKEGGLYSTNVTLPTIVTQASIDESGSAAQICNATDGYIVLGSDIDLANYRVEPTTVFTGVLDGNGYTIKNIVGEDTVDKYGAKYTQGTSLFYQVKDAIVKNLVLENVYATTGMLTERVEGSCIFKNIIARMSGYRGARTSLLGYHAEDMDVSDVENVIIEMPVMSVPESGTYVGMLTTHAGGKVNIKNLFLLGGNGLIHSTLGNNATFVPKHYTERDDSADGMAEEGLDYFIGSSAEVVFDCYNEGFGTDFLMDMAKKCQMITALDNSNIDVLQTAVKGYFYLTEDIDMARFATSGEEGANGWLPTQNKGTEFTGTINGNGYSIYNFTAPDGHLGLIGWTGKGATIKDVNIHIVTNTNKGGIIGQVKGLTTISNVNIEIDKFVTQYGGPITSVVQGDLVVSDSTIKINSADTSKGTYVVGFVAGGEAPSYNVTVDRVYVYDGSGLVTEPYKTKNSKDVEFLTYNKDGELATLNKEYFYVTGDLIEFDTETIEDAGFKAFVEDAKAKTIENAIKITKENVTDLLTAEIGYYLLCEDIDMSTVDLNGEEEGMGTWAPTGKFAGTFNGQGYKITNLAITAVGQHGLFMELNAGTIVKNLTLVGSAEANNNGLLAGTIRGTGVTIDNVIIEATSFKSLAGGIIARNLTAPKGIKLINTTIIVHDSLNNTNNGIVFGNYGAKGSAIVDGFYIFDLATAGTRIKSLHNSYVTFIGSDEEEAVLGEDYYLYSGDIFDMDLETVEDEQVKAYVDEVYAAKQESAIAVSKDNVDVLLTATEGYYYLTEDIDMSGKTWSGSGTFTGTFNGKGHTIYNLKVGNGQMGLFASLNGNSVVKNLILKADCTGNNNGSIAATFRNAGNVMENVIIEVSKLSGYAAGGLARNLASKEALTMKNVSLIIKDSAISGANGLLFGNYGAAGSMTVEGLNIYDLATSGSKVTALHNGYVTILGVDGEEAVLGEDYNIMSGDILDFDVDAIENETVKAMIKAIYDAQLASAVAVNKDNVDVLLTATEGYYYLTEDIDMSGKAWAPTGNFVGTLNGKGHTISNLKVGTGQIGLFSSVNGNAVIKNLILKADCTGNNNGSIAATFRNAGNVMENVVIEVSKLSGYAAGGLARNLASLNALTMKNVSLIIKDSAISGANGLLFGNYGAAGSMTVEGLNIYDLATSGSKVTALHNGYVSILGADGEEAVLGEDYNIISGDIFDLDIDAIENETVKAILKEVYDAQLASAIAINKDNISTLATATTGYYYLTEDIDMTSVEYACAQTSAAPFVGTLNGMGHKIYNFTPASGTRGGLFDFTGTNAVIKNLDFHAVTNLSKAAFIGFVKGTTVVDNCNFRVDTLAGNYAGTVANVVQGELMVKNTNVYVGKCTSDYGTGLVSGFEASTKPLTLSNVYVYCGDTVTTNLFGATSSATGTIIGTLNTDYFAYTALNDLKAAYEENKLPEDFVEMLVEAEVLTPKTEG